MIAGHPPDVAAQPRQDSKIKTQTHKWPDAVLIIILGLLPLLFFWRLLTPNPADRMAIAGGDFTEQYFPLRAFGAQEWGRGQIPLWNPYLYGGQPALADIQSGALYPPHVLESLWLGWSGLGFPVWALEWQVIAHFSLAAVGTYLFVRHLGCQRGVSLRQARFGGVMAALVFTYGGYLTGFPVQQITILEVSAWLPWVMWAVSAATARPPTHLAPPLVAGQAADRRPLTVDQQSVNDKEQNTHSQPARITYHAPRLLRSPAPFWGALAFAMAILAGHPQTVLYIFYLSFAYALFRAFNQSANQRTQRAGVANSRLAEDGSLIEGESVNGKLTFILRSLLSWLIIIVLGAAIAAAQLLPTWEFIARSLRADLSYQAVSAGLPLNEFVSILYPGFFGGSPAYVGIVSLVLIALALIIIPNPQSPISNPKDIYFWAGAGLVSLLLAFGSNTFLYPLIYLLTPGFEAVRQQERAFLVYSFSAAVLAGYGAMVLAGPLPKLARATYTRFERRLRGVAVVAVALTAFFIYGSAVSTARGDEVNLFYGVLWHHLFGLIILAGMLILLILRSRRWLRRVWGMTLLALWLAFNLFTVNWRFNLEKPPNPPPFSSNAVTQFLQTNLPILQSSNLPILQPSNPPTRIVSGGLLPGGNSAASVYQLQDLTGNTPLQLAVVDSFMQQMPPWRLWQLLSVRYVVDKRNIADAGLKLVFEEGDLKVFEMGDPFPRAWFVAGTEVVAHEGQAITRLAADDFDLHCTAIVPTPLDLPAAEPTASTVSIEAISPTHLTAEVNASSRQLLVFSQIYYPGWKARVDGQPAELLQVNVIQQGVVVPAGQHSVELVFSPRSFWVGVIISSIALLICLILLVRGRWQED
ncbi:MAG TPA: YfhO family protein [Anaerolineae bacterium]|nr:YfhO family protein [Anaerolineae bacterium]